MKTFSQRFAEVYNDEIVEGSIYRIDLDRVDVVPLGSTGIMRSLPLTGDRDKVQVGDRVRVMRVGGERVALVGDVALGFDYEEEVTEIEGGVTPLDLEEALTDRQGAPDIYVLKNAEGQVGINRAPDPQFDLDVAGSIRTGGYFVGPHALQLAGAKMIAHFDGPDPLATDTKGEANGHMGQIGTLTGTYDYRPGKFNKALHLSPLAMLSYECDKVIDITKPGTLSFWRRTEVGDTDTPGADWFTAGGVPPNFFTLRNSADALSLEFVINATTLTMLLPEDNEFHHYVLTWDGITASLYIDGVRHPEYLDEVTTQSGAYTAPTVNPATLVITSAIHTLDDLTSLDHAILGSEVLAIYQSNAPVFAETSVWGFRSPNTYSYVDSEGLWAVSSAGNPAFGVSGIDGKVWGGQTLDAGDVMIGRGANCIRWDDSAGTAIFAVDGAGITNINGSNITTGTISADRIDVASLSVSNANITSLDAAKITTGYINAARINVGTITAGMLATTALDAKTITGSTIRTSAANPRVEMTTTGLRGYDSGGIVQAYFGSDGKFYAGAGNASLSADGIKLIGNTIATVDNPRSVNLVTATGTSLGQLWGFYSGTAVGTTYLSNMKNEGPTSKSIIVQCESFASPSEANTVLIAKSQTNMARIAVNAGIGGAYATRNIVLEADLVTLQANDVSIPGELTVNYGLNVTGSTSLANLTCSGVYIGSAAVATLNCFRSSGNLIISPKDTGNLYLNHDQGLGNTYISGGGSNILVTIASNGKLTTSQGISGATWYPIPAETVFSHNGTGNAVLGDHRVNLAPDVVPANAIAVTGRLGGIFGAVAATNWMAISKYGETGTGIYAGVVRADSTVVHNSSSFTCACTTDNLAGISIHVNGATALSMYLVITGYFVEL